MIPLGILNYKTIDQTVNPVTTGLILELYSGTGLQTSGSDVTGWDDQSGLGNNLTWFNGYPSYTNSFFGTERSVNFANNSYLSGTVSGLTGSQAFTIFAVSEHDQPTTGIFFFRFIPGCDIYLQRPFTTTQLVSLVSGNSGLFINRIDTVDNVPQVYAYLADFSTNPDTGIFYINGSSASSINGLSQDNTSAFSDGSVGIGHSSMTTIRYGSILMYNRRLSESEIVSVNSYLTTKYSV